MSIRQAKDESQSTKIPSHSIPIYEISVNLIIDFNKSRDRPIIDKARLGCFYVTAILSWGYGWFEVDIKDEVDLHLRLNWGWNEIDSKFSWNQVEVELSWIWDKLTLYKGRNWFFIGFR